MEKYNRIFKKIEDIIIQKNTVLIGIDGRCGSGKSTLATEIANIYGGNVFHIDDFYIPFNKREADFQNRIGGNIDWERFTKDILGNITHKKNFSYNKYSCKEDEFQEVQVIANKINIIEGAYSNLAKVEYDIKIFLDVDSKTQLERIEKRNGEKAKESFIKIWIPLEERYIKETDLLNQCDLLVDTSNFW